jgi:hypothetical protein
MVGFQPAPHLFLYDQNTGSYTIINYPDTSAAPYAFGINDFGQVVGCANRVNKGPQQSFLAAPQ